MNGKTILGIAALAAMLCACDSSSSKKESGNLLIPTDGNENRFDNDYVTEDPDEGVYAPDEYQERQSYQEQLVICPMCGGSGIFECMPGDVMAPRETCSGCGGNGAVTEYQARQIANAINQVNAIMGGGNGYDGGGYNSGGSGRSAYDIERDLKKAYDLLEGMERDYANCSSNVLKAQYPSMISEQKQRIAALEAELRNAQY